MRTRTPSPTSRSTVLPTVFQAELDSFLLACEAVNLAPKTRRTYEEAVALLGQFLVERAMPSEPARIRREHVEAFIADQTARWRPNTARNRHLALKRFFDWLAEEGLTDLSPMARMRPPRVPEEPVPLLREDAVRALLRACEGHLFNDRRDAALSCHLAWTRRRVARDPRARVLCSRHASQPRIALLVAPQGLIPITAIDDDLSGLVLAINRPMWRRAGSHVLGRERSHLEAVWAGAEAAKASASNDVAMDAQHGAEAGSRVGLSIVVEVGFRQLELIGVDGRDAGSGSAGIRGRRRTIKSFA